MMRAHEARAVAVAAECDERTVKKRVAGRPVQGVSAQRVDRALRAHGWREVRNVSGEIVGWTREVTA